MNIIKFIYISIFTFLLIFGSDLQILRANDEKMSLIPAGKFYMGDSFQVGDVDEKPVHLVNIEKFHLDKHEVTNAEYKKCVDSGNCKLPKNLSSVTRKIYFGNSEFANYPVIFVDWNDAQTYCKWKGKRLPTEAEWEYAALGGAVSALYTTGKTLECKDANFDRSKKTSKCFGYNKKVNDTHQIGEYPPNGYGLYNIIGNVHEWVQDFYGKEYYSKSAKSNPKGPDDGDFKVERGGSWASPKTTARVANRNYAKPDFGIWNIGIRCAK